MNVQRPTHEINDGRFQRRLAHVMGKLQIKDDDCWIWASTCFNRSYENGRTKKIPFFVILDPGTRLPRQVYARRWAWENAFGPLPEGTSVINVCGEEKCVKPHYNHNRPVSNGQWLKPGYPEYKEHARSKAPGSDEEFLAK